MNNPYKTSSRWRRITDTIRNALPSPIRNFWESYKTRVREIEARLESPDKTVKGWKQIYIEDRKRLKKLKFWERAIPIIAAITTLTLVMLVAGLTLYGLVLLFGLLLDAVVDAFTSLPLLLRLMFYMVVALIIFAFYILAVNWIRKFFNEPIPYAEEDGSLYDLILKTAYRAITDGDSGGEACHKVGFYKPKTPEAITTSSLQ